MHEMSLAEGILQLVEDTAAREGASRVSRVILDVGELASVEVEALTFCFDVVTRGGVAEGAKLEIDRVPGAGWCMPCGKTVPMHEHFGQCPDCGSAQVQATQGTEMRVREIEID